MRLASSALIVLALAACGDPTGNQDRIGRATLNLETPSGKWTYSDGEAGSDVQRSSPTADPYMLFLAMSAGSNTPGAVEIDLSQLLGADISPKPGVYRAAGFGTGAI